MGVTIVGPRPSLPNEGIQGNSVGLETMARMPGLASQNTTSSQRLWLTYFTAYQAFTINTIAVCTAGTPAGATPTLIRYGLYTASTDGALTGLVASTANDTTLLASGNTLYPKATSASYTTVIGQRYAGAFLCVTGATVPTLQGASGAATLFALAPRVAAYVGSQADLPSTVAVGSLTSTGTGMWMGFY